MSTTFEFIFELPGVGRGITDDGWEEIDAAHIEYWKAASSLLGTRTFDYRGHSVTLEVDWRPILRRHQRHYRVMQQLYEAAGTPAAYDIAQKFSRTRVKVPAKLTTTFERGRIDEWQHYSLVFESFLYDTFLMMNIAAPGSCNFYNAALRLKPSRRSTEISLSEFYFDIAYLNGRQGKWPSPKMIPLETLSQWFFAVRSGVLQIPQNRMEKVLFALLHIAKMDMSPMIVIWLFYALETLFDTKAGENFRVLTERVQLLLSPNEKEAKRLRKNLRAMYDLRSGIVHGGLEVAHPMHNEQLDPVVDEKYARLSAVSEFGFGLLLRAIQMVIEKNWRWPQFDEVMRGNPVTL